VLLLFDNFGDEQISDLMEKIVNEARMLDIERLKSIAFVSIVCSRKATVKRTSDENTFLLESHLSEAELIWLRDKYTVLEKNFKLSKGMNPRNFISFNILKENFDQGYIRKSVKDLTSDITVPQERNLLMYISLINRFDLLVHPLPVASFDCIMGKAKWETDISQPLRVLLNETLERGFGAIGAFRIINNSLSKYIFENLSMQDGKKRLEGEVMLEFLNTSVFKSTESVVEDLLKVIRILMKNRERKHTTGIYLTQFAPLVQTIVNDAMQSVPLAANVLKRVYELSDDLFVAQQIARLYIFSRNWVEATQYGEIITTNFAKNSFFWDTLAQVFKGQLLEKYHESLEKKGTNCALVPATEAHSVLNIRFRAIDVFKREQQVSENEMSTSTTNNAGYFGEVETVARLLDYMTSVDGLQEITHLQKFLFDDSFVPKNIHCCWDKNLINKVKKLLVNVVQTLKRLDDESLQVKLDYKDENTKIISKYHQESLLKHRECIDGYMCEGVQEVPPGYSKAQASGFYRRRIQALRGNTLKGLFDMRGSADAADKLKSILNLAEKNIGTEFEVMADLQVYLGTSIALGTLGCKDGFTLDRMVQLSTNLYERYDIHNGTDLEPYMFVFMFNWPRDDLPDRPISLAAHRLPEVLQNWNKAFNRKYPKKQEQGRKETTLFFLANGDGANRYLYEGQLPKRTRYRNTEFWNSEFVSDKLQRLSGVLLSQGNAVKVTMEQDGNKSAIEIPASLPQKNVTWHNKMVLFYLGISWSGPKAYNISIEEPRSNLSAATGHSNDYSPTTKLRPIPNQHYTSQTRQSQFHSSTVPSVSHHQQFTLKMQELRKREDELNEQLQLLNYKTSSANKKMMV